MSAERGDGQQEITWYEISPTLTLSAPLPEHSNERVSEYFYTKNPQNCELFKTLQLSC